MNSIEVFCPESVVVISRITTTEVEQNVSIEYYWMFIYDAIIDKAMNVKLSWVQVSLVSLQDLFPYTIGLISGNTRQTEDSTNSPHQK